MDRLDATREMEDEVNYCVVYNFIAEKICRRGRLRRDQLHRESSLIKDLGLDSLEVVELVLDLETEYGVELQESDYTPRKKEIALGVRVGRLADEVVRKVEKRKRETQRVLTG